MSVESCQTSERQEEKIHRRLVADGVALASQRERAIRMQRTFVEEFSGDGEELDWSQGEAKAECNQIVRRLIETEGCEESCRVGLASRVYFCRQEDCQGDGS